MADIPQRYRGVIVSTWSRATRRSKPTVAVSTSIASYVQLNEAQLRWLVEVGGPKALAALRDSRGG